jgi:hypothetical protein
MIRVGKREVVMRSMILKRAGTLVLAAGCATAGQGAGSGQPAPNPEPRVEVQNDNWADVTVYAIRDGSSIRLGDVMAGDSAVCTLPDAVVQAPDAYFLVRPLASSVAYVSPSILWDQDMTLRIANDLSQSTLVPWRNAG